ncbi:hypothetical protein AB0B63_07145 [Micromonospora sp. NPDC049081]|uniref:hypothetical protein n=1 Tax=Micromonospora sp. NPDC049081 TaxID=3155150 RepID=UPI00340A4978
MKLNDSRIRILRAAQRGDLFHSIYGGYDWINLEAPDGGRVAGAAQAALRAGHIELLPRQRGHEHRGQPYKLTDTGRAVLDAHDTNGK